MASYYKLPGVEVIVDGRTVEMHFEPRERQLPGVASGDALRALVEDAVLLELADMAQEQVGQLAVA
ncbi:MAG: hypothetical protein RBS80_12935 [Thermoguttaceae bacterium]|jgi:hypothetical protein|nr:hypothetical protein [Thermoguttaceae bacterium]